MDLATLEQVNAARVRREAVIVVTEIATGAARAVREADVAATKFSWPSSCRRRGWL